MKVSAELKARKTAVGLERICRTSHVSNVNEASLLATRKKYES